VDRWHDRVQRKYFGEYPACVRNQSHCKVFVDMFEARFWPPAIEVDISHTDYRLAQAKP